MKNEIQKSIKKKTNEQYKERRNEASGARHRRLREQKTGRTSSATSNQKCNIQPYFHMNTGISFLFRSNAEFSFNQLLVQLKSVFLCTQLLTMGLSNNMTVEEQAIIIIKWDNGDFIRKIANKLGRSATSLWRLIIYFN